MSQKTRDPVEKLGKGLLYAGGAYAAYKVGGVVLGLASFALTTGVFLACAAAIGGGVLYGYRRIVDVVGSEREGRPRGR